MFFFFLLDVFACSGSTVSCMQITLSKTLEGIDVNDIGYQPPLPPEEMNPGDFHPMREAALIASS